MDTNCFRQSDGSPQALRPMRRPFLRRLTLTGTPGSPDPLHGARNPFRCGRARLHSLPNVGDSILHSLFLFHSIPLLIPQSMSPERPANLPNPNAFRFQSSEPSSCLGDSVVIPPLRSVCGPLGNVKAWLKCVAILITVHLPSVVFNWCLVTC